MLNLLPEEELNEHNFSMFYHLKEISGILSFDAIPATNRIIFPNLRIVRGRELLSDRYSLVLVNVDIGEFILPKLTEITVGSVLVEKRNSTRRLCNLKRVKWTDILDDGLFIDDTCTNATSDGMYIHNVY